MIQFFNTSGSSRKIPTSTREIEELDHFSSTLERERGEGEGERKEEKGEEIDHILEQVFSFCLFSSLLFFVFFKTLFSSLLSLSLLTPLFPLSSLSLFPLSLSLKPQTSKRAVSENPLWVLIYMWVPEVIQMLSPRVIFRTSEDGCRLDSMLRKCINLKPLVILIRADQKVLFYFVFFDFLIFFLFKSFDIFL